MSQDNNDFITITTTNGIKKNAELIIKYEVKGLGEYVIYKLEGNLYGAKYQFDGKNTKLITNLTEQEKNIIYEMINNLEVK